jgi:hypothetical protein
MVQGFGFSMKIWGFTTTVSRKRRRPPPTPSGCGGLRDGGRGGSCGEVTIDGRKEEESKSGNYTLGRLQGIHN